jgi:hypothetical protein
VSAKDESTEIDDGTYQEVIESRIELLQFLSVKLLKDRTLHGEDFLMTIFKVPE